jgi:hypothetical protein
MNSYTIRPNQSLFDIAVETYGDVEGVFWLLKDNPSLPGVTGPLVAGETLAIRPERINARSANYLADFAPFQTIEKTDFPTGIGYWRVEDYVVQAP